MKKAGKLRVGIFGAGKVGVGLHRALRAKGKVKSYMVAARKGAPRRPFDANLVILAVRDRYLPEVCETLIAAGSIPKDAVAVHVAGALDADVLSPLRPHCAGVAQMHPMIAYASRDFQPQTLRGQVHIQGDELAVKRARKLANHLGMSPRTIENLNTVGYHAAAGLVANGAAALAAAGVEILRQAGVEPRVATRMLGPLLRSVGDNVEALGMPDGLTGPVRRGEAAGVGKHIAALSKYGPEFADLYRTMGRAQLPLARAIGEASPEAFDDVETALKSPSELPNKRPRELHQRKSPMSIRLHVNIDHVATIRNARGTSYPDPVTAASLAELAGADGITCHLREDRRHITDADVSHLKKSVLSLLNLEMAPTEEMLAIALAAEPDVVTLVPERRQERTTEGGLDAAAIASELRPMIDALQVKEIKVSLFLAPAEKQILTAKALGVEQIELHTGDYANTAGSARQAELAKLEKASKLVCAQEIALAAGHGLTRHNVGDIAGLPGLEELNIGHALIADAVFMGMDRAVREMRRAIDVGAQRSKA